MNKAARMMLLSRSGHDDKGHDWDRRYDIKTYNGGNYDGSRGGQGRDGRGVYRGRMDYDNDMEYNYPYRENMRYDYSRDDNNMRYDHDPKIEDAFYDRRGRRHYDNGRYAPKAMYGEIYPYYPTRIPERYNSDNDYKNTRMGFNHGYEFEMDGIAGDMKGYAKGRISPTKDHYMINEEPEKLDEKTAKKWVKSMENADGTKGGHWTQKETDEIMEKLGLDCDSLEFWVAMCAVYSDFCEVFKQLGIDKPENYAEFAEAFWFEDEDAKDNKLARYYEYIVK